MSIIQKLNKDFESRVRLGIMSVLVVNDWVEFKEIRSLLQVTDGNLASHAKALEKKDYIEIKKEFVGKKPRTSYRATLFGRESLKQHIDELEKLLSK